jgi:hypothetical protein
MEPVAWAVVAGAAVLALLLLLLATRARRRRRASARSGELRDRFGPEYERTITTRGRDQGERDLEARVERYRRHPARPLSAEDRRQVVSRWGELQAAYVDDPGVAIQRAEVLLRTILDRREVPSDHVDDRVTAAAFVRPDLAEEYRKAHQVFVDVEAGRSSPQREHDRRMAFLVYRHLILDHSREPEAAPRDDDPVEVREGDVSVSS